MGHGGADAVAFDETGKDSGALFVVQLVHGQAYPCLHERSSIKVRLKRYGVCARISGGPFPGTGALTPAQVLSL